MMRALLFLFGGFWIANVHAQGLTATTPTLRYADTAEKQLGWVPHAEISANASISSSKDTVGQTNGTSETYGGKFLGAMNYNQELSEWRNGLSIRELTTRTASLPRYVKTLDEAKFETAYLYFFPHAPHFGPYVSASAMTSLFNGEDVHDSDRSYQIHRRNGTTDSFTGSTLHLTDSWHPLTLNQSAGLFWKAIDTADASLETRLGIGAMEIQASGQYAVQGANDAGQIDVLELHDFQQVGAEAGLLFKGRFNEQNGIEVAASAMTPFYHTREPDDNRSEWRLTNYEVDAKLISKMTSWLSVSYDYRIRYQPQLIDKVQYMQLLAVNLNYNLL